MQENIKSTTSIIKPSQSLWYMSMSLFLLVSWLSGYFAISNYYLEKDIALIQSEIDKVEQDIVRISEDKKIVIANIIKDNTLRPSLNLGPIIKQFRVAAIKANVRLKWFTIDKDVITTSLIATEWDPGIHPDPASTIIKMIREYAQWKMDFTLEPISSLSWDSSMRTTGIEFHVLPSKIQ
jgi:hypothetical protein